MGVIMHRAPASEQSIQRTRHRSFVSSHLLFIFFLPLSVWLFIAVTPSEGTSVLNPVDEVKQEGLAVEPGGQLRTFRVVIVGHAQREMRRRRGRLQRQAGQHKRCGNLQQLHRLRGRHSIQFSICMSRLSRTNKTRRKYILIHSRAYICFSLKMVERRTPSNETYGLV